VFPVRYELNFYIVFRRNSVFKGLSKHKRKSVRMYIYAFMVYVTTLVSSPYNVTSNDCMIVDYECERMGKEAIRPNFRCNSGIGTGGRSEDNHEESKSA
jgi:hypothetical protein